MGANITSYSDVKLKAGTQYYYRVRGYQSKAYSDYSNEANATTLSPGQVSLYAQIQGPPDGNLATDMLVKFYSPGGSGTPFYSQTVSLNDYGQGSFLPVGLSSGAYDVWGKVGTHLAKRINSWSYAADTFSSLDFGLLLAGDLNNDNTVGQADYDYMQSVWRTSDPVADIDRDGWVLIYDYSILISNWGVAGDQ